MDELKRWREERAVRQTARLLRDYADPDEEVGTRSSRRRPGHPLQPRRVDLGSRAAQGVRWVSLTRESKETLALREAQAIRELGPIKDSTLERLPGGGFRIWPPPPNVSPVHPEWDDPTGRRFRAAFYRALAVHVILIPSFLLLSRVHFDLSSQPAVRDRVIAINFTPPAGGGDGRPTPETPRAPQAPKPPAPKPQAPKPQTTSPKPHVRPTVTPVNPKPDVAHANVKPVPDNKAPKDTTRVEDRAENSRRSPSRDTEAATDPIAKEGPLFAGKGPVAGSGASIDGLDGVDFPYNRYLELVRGKIAQSWQVPENYVSKGRRLETMVRFRINRNGSVAESSIEEPSGFSFYDQAALRAVVSVRNFPPLPQEFGGNFLVVHFQFTYTGR